MHPYLTELGLNLNQFFNEIPVMCVSLSLVDFLVTLNGFSLSIAFKLEKRRVEKFWWKIFKEASIA